MAKRWDSAELIAAVNDFLDGKGLRRASAAMGRSVSAVYNVVAYDLPNNYRNCVTWMNEKDAAGRRAGRPWSATEIRYLNAVKAAKKLETWQVCKVLGRPIEEVAAKLAEIAPPRKGLGFFTEEELK